MTGYATSPRSKTARRSNSRNLSPSKRPTRPRDGDNSKAAPAGKGPDPSEFDPEFVIGEDDDQPSRAATPRPKEKAPAADAVGENGDEKKEDSQAAQGEGEAEAPEKAEQPPEIPPEVKLRLRRLDKLEPKYTGKWYSGLPLWNSSLVAYLGLEMLR